MHFLSFYTVKTIDVTDGLRKLLSDVLTSLPVSHAILPCAVCFATSRPANHAICSFIDWSGYASGPIRRCLFIDYIIILCMQHCYGPHDITLLNGPKHIKNLLLL